MHKTWIIPQQRYVTVVFESQEDVDRWESLFKALVELNASEDAIGTLCAEVYGGPAWLYRPPSGMIELYVPHVITEFSDCMRQYDWGLYEGQQPVRRYDGTGKGISEGVGNVADSLLEAFTPPPKFALLPPKSPNDEKSMGSSSII